MSRLVDLTGQQYGNLTVIKRAENGANRKAQWVCRCVCGKVVTVRGEHLRSGATSSCGCSKNVKHGLSKTRLYTIWLGMIHRCCRPEDKSYSRYGARGITVCAAWKNDFLAFQSWALKNGYKDTLSIERMDNDGNYEPANCCWRDSKEQARNRESTILVEYLGKAISLKEFAAELHIPYSTVRRKYNEGEPIQSIIEYSRGR